MVGLSWQVYRRRPDTTLLHHLCQIRQLDPNRLEFNFESDPHDPMLLSQMDQARALMREAVKKQWPVAIFGDYDADGTPAAAILSAVCQRLGLESQVYLPTRTTGYGLTSSFLRPIAKAARLLITVDTGITAIEPISQLNEMGVQTIILDHHLPSSLGLPPAAAIIDPHLDGSAYPFADICGCTLAFKFAQALSQDFPDQITEGFLKWQLDLVAISTVSDMMILRDENRTFVHYGLEVIKKTRRPGLQALLRQAGLKPETITAGSIGYTIGPRFNAAGRMGDNRPIFDLLTTTSMAEAEKLAADIESLNRQRQELVEEVLTQAEQNLLTQNTLKDFALVVVEDDWPPGVVGLVAGRLAEKYYRPVVVGSRHKGLIRASGRSISDYPLIDGLTASSKYLERFGGHRQAAGLSASAANWDKFAQALKDHAGQHFDSTLPRRVLRADAYLDLADSTLEQVRELTLLEPYGLGNPKPTFIIRDLIWTDLQAMGATKQHARVQLGTGKETLAAVGFSLYERLAKAKHQRISVAGHLSENVWQDRRSVQFQIIDFKGPKADIKEVDFEDQPHHATAEKVAKS